MELDDKDYILGYWFALDNDDDCWYAIVKKGSKPNSWHGQYTFRYNREKEGKFDPFAGVDKKSIQEFKMRDKKEDEVIEEMNVLHEAVKMKYSEYSDSFLVRGDVSKFMEIAKTKHYLHMKQVSNVPAPESTQPKSKSQEVEK